MFGYYFKKHYLHFLFHYQSKFRRINPFLLKIILDYSISFIVLIATFPLVLFYSVLVVFANSTAPFLIQERYLGLKGEPIKIFKLKTLKNSARIGYSSKGYLRKNIPKTEYLVFGKYFRERGLDEIPQFLNVLLGQLSIVGPRPLIKSDLEKIDRELPELSSFRNELNLKAGITCLWQLKRGGEFALDEMLKYDREYANTASLKLDLKIIAGSFVKIFKAGHSDTLKQEN